MKLGTQVSCYPFPTFRRAYNFISIGFPPTDRALRGWFYKATTSSNPVDTARVVETLVSSILAVLHRRLEVIASGEGSVSAPANDVPIGLQISRSYRQ